jgi:hypothetical protein
MRMTDEEFLDKCAIEAIQSCIVCDLGPEDNAKYAFDLAEAMVKERKNRIAKSHGKQDD